MQRRPQHAGLLIILRCDDRRGAVANEMINRRSSMGLLLLFVETQHKGIYFVWAILAVFLSPHVTGGVTAEDSIRVMVEYLAAAVAGRYP